MRRSAFSNAQKFPFMMIGPESEESMQPPQEREEADMSEMGLLPLSFFSGKEPQPGEICSVEVVKVYDDQVAVRYVKHDGESAPMEDDPMAGAEEAPLPPAPEDDEEDSMGY